MASDSFSHRSANRLLSGLPAEAWESLRPQLESVSLGERQVLVRPSEPFDYVYFPERSLASITTALDEGAVVEVGVVGREGMIGLPVVLGIDLAPPLEVFIQIADGGWRMKANLLRPEMERSPALRERLFRYVLARQAQIARTAACNARHPINERLARWLLMAREAVQRDELPLTQEFLSMMLGVRRAGVSVAAGTLRRAGLIDYTPGRVAVLNPAGLRAAACDCFEHVQQEYDRLLG